MQYCEINDKYEVESQILAIVLEDSNEFHIKSTHLKEKNKQRCL